MTFLDHGLVSPSRHGMTIDPTLLESRSTGSISLHSPNPFDKPVIAPNYLSDPEGEDLQAMVAGVRIAQKIYATSALAPYVEALKTLCVRRRPVCGTKWERVGWAQTEWRWSILNCASTVCMGCGLSMLR